MGHLNSSVLVVVFAGALLASVACGGESLSTLDPRLEQFTPTYERDVRPVLQRHCVTCHRLSGKLLGGVALDSFETAWANRVRNACTAIVPELVEKYRDHLLPVPRDPPAQQKTCGDWKVYSMPTKAQPSMTLAEQVVLVRWVATGATR